MVSALTPREGEGRSLWEGSLMTDLSPSEVARELGVSRSAVYRGIEDGQIPAYKFRGRLRVTPDAVQRVREQNRVKPRRVPAPPMFEPRPSREEDSFLEPWRRNP
jgi:excisionase family DNA binding protein